MVNYQEARVKLTYTQLNKLKSAAKNKTGLILRLHKQNFNNEKLPNALIIATRQTTKIRDAFANVTSTYVKLSKAQISKIIQSGGYFGSCLGNLGKKAPTNIAIPLARDNLPESDQFNFNAINKFEIKIDGKGAVKAGKKFTLFISIEYMNYIIKIIRSLEDLGVLIDRVTETVTHEMKKQEGRFPGAMLVPSSGSLLQPEIYSVVKG